MDLTLYTTYAEVSGLLGEDDFAISATSVFTQTSATRASEALYSVSPNLQAYYEGLILLPSPTAAQTRLINLVKVLVTALLSRYLLDAAEIRIPKVIDDSKARRDLVEKPFEVLIDRIDRLVSDYTGKVAASYLDLTGTSSNTVTPVYISAVGLAFDPVTGE